jgi:hypothetical protein
VTDGEANDAAHVNAEAKGDDDRQGVQEHVSGRDESIHGSASLARSYGHGFVVGHGVGPFPGSWQQTDTHCVVPSAANVTVAVDVSLEPPPMSVPVAAPPSFWSTPNQGSAPIWKLALAGVATIVTTLPGATEAVSVAAVDAAPPLIATEHQLRKFMTVSVGAPP